MTINNLVPLDLERIDAINVGMLDLGPGGSDIITKGEVSDLADYFDIGERSVRRWFAIPNDGGEVDQYRRMIPASKFPRGVLGLRIALMYPPESTPTNIVDAAERFKINNLRKRCLMAAAAGTGGYVRDPLFHGRHFNIKTPPCVTLSSCVRNIIEPVILGEWGENGEFYRAAWIRFTIQKMDTGFWEVVCICVEPDRGAPGGTPGQDTGYTLDIPEDDPELMDDFSDEENSGG